MSDFTYPAEAVRCAYERGKAEAFASAIREVEQLPRYGLCIGHQTVTGLIREDVLTILRAEKEQK